MAAAAELGPVRRGLEAIYRDMHRGVWSRPLHVREQFPARQGPGQLSGDLQRLQAPFRQLQREREDRAVLEDGGGFLSTEILEGMIRKSVKRFPTRSPNKNLKRDDDSSRFRLDRRAGRRRSRLRSAARCRARSAAPRYRATGRASDYPTTDRRNNRPAPLA